jgi:hypothetical protein
LISQRWRPFFFTKASQAKFTVLSSRNNCLLSVYDVSSNENDLLQSHSLPYSLSCRFPNGPHAGFCVVHPHPESRNTTTASLLQLTSRSGIYQIALALCRDGDTTPTPIPATIDVSWSSAVDRLATPSGTQRSDVGKLGARAMQEVDFRQAYQRMSFHTSQHILSRRSKCYAFRAVFPA